MLAKLPLLAASTVCDHFALTAPNPTPPPEERAKFDPSNGAHESGPFTLLHAAAVLQKLVHILNAVEALSIVTALYPALLGYMSWSPLPADTSIVSRIGITMPFTIGFIMMLSGTLTRVTAYRQLGHCFTFHLAVRKEHKLITNGLYSIVRHPSYTGALLFFYGAAISQMGPGSYWAESGMWRGVIGQVYGAVYLSMIAYLTIGIVIRVRQEDGILRAEFQQQWDMWAKDTRYRLIPYIF